MLVQTICIPETYSQITHFQEGHPIAFASRTLTKSEQKWAQIEKELLAIVFACQRFHYFVYGRKFTIESGHKPLETLTKKDIDDVTMRLQRMFMFLLKYPGMNITYRPGKEMLVADCLSRAQLSEEEDLEGLSGVIHRITEEACRRKILKFIGIFWRVMRNTVAFVDMLKTAGRVFTSWMICLNIFINLNVNFILRMDCYC